MKPFPCSVMTAGRQGFFPQGCNCAARDRTARPHRAYDLLPAASATYLHLYMMMACKLQGCHVHTNVYNDISCTCYNSGPLAYGKGFTAGDWTRLDFGRGESKAWLKWMRSHLSSKVFM